MSGSRLPLALGPEPAAGEPVAGPFTIRTSEAGNAFLLIRGTGMAFTACLSAPQLRALASLAAAAAARLERTGPAEVVSIFAGRP